MSQRYSRIGGECPYCQGKGKRRAARDLYPYPEYLKPPVTKCQGCRGSGVEDGLNHTRIFGPH